MVPVVMILVILVLMKVIIFVISDWDLFRGWYLVVVMVGISD